MATRPAAEDMQALLEAALLAPSSHNTQPWVFTVAGSCVRVFADRTRALPANDPDDRELTISCGCALMNLRVAAAARRLAPRTVMLPDPDDPDLLAEVELAPAAGNAVELAELAELAAEIPRRRTVRQRFADEPVPAATTGALGAAARAEGATLHFVTSEHDRGEVVRLIGEGDAAQWADPSWRRELAQWMHARRKGDGLAVPGLIAPIAQAVIRTFDMGGGVAAKDRQLADASPLLAVLGTAGDGPLDWLRAGQALQSALLTASRAGLQASYLNQPIEVSALRPELRALLPGRPFPQILLRLGVPTGAVAAAPRRRLEEVWQP